MNFFTYIYESISYNSVIFNFGTRQDFWGRGLRDAEAPIIRLEGLRSIEAALDFRFDHFIVGGGVA